MMIEEITHVLLALCLINFIIAGIISLVAYGYYHLNVDSIKNFFNVKIKKNIFGKT